MKILISIAIYGTLILFSASMAAYGIFTMINDVIHGTDIGRGFLFFSLGLLTIGMCGVLYILGSVLNGIKLLNEQILPLIISNNKPSQNNPLSDLLNKIRNQSQDGAPEGFSEMLGSMTIAKFNEDGTFTPLEKREFSSDEEMRAMRDEMLNRAFSKKNKKLEDMSISELEVEREKAVETQEFELAGAIRNLIEQKKSL